MKYRFLIYISYSYALPIGNPLEREILKRGYEVKWFSDTPEGLQSLKEGKKRNILSLEEAIAYKPHIVLTATDIVADFISGIKVQIFHGFQAEKRPEKQSFAHFRIRGFFDLYCTQGPNTTKTFKTLAKEKKFFEVIETGWSKVDPLFPIEIKKTSSTPHVMIASTFTKRLSLAYDNDVFEEIKRLSKTGKFLFSMVLHPKLPQEIKEKWVALNNANFTYYNTTDLIPIFKETDFLFADTTSAIQEFILQKKPVITFNHTLAQDYLIDIDHASKIEEAFNLACEPSKELLEAITNYIEKLHPYFDGKSSARVIDACIIFLLKDKTHLKPKPCNLIRKYKIRKRLNYFTFKTNRVPLTLKKRKENLTKLTAIIPTGNEIHNIEEVIKSVSFADEILVVDSFSKDGSYEKAKELATKVIRREYHYSASQKNWAIPQAKHEWILLIDADERVTPELKEEILSILKNPPTDDTVAYWIGRKNHFMGKPVNHSGWKNDKVIRLFKRDFCKYEDKKVHAEIIAKGKVGKLKHKFYHNTYITIDKHLEKMNRYGWWQASDYDKKVGKLTPYHFVIKPMWSFFKHYIIQGGFRDGVVGLTISYIQSYTVFMRFVKVWLLRRDRK